MTDIFFDEGRSGPERLSPVIWFVDFVSFYRRPAPVSRAAACRRLKRRPRQVRQSEDLLRLHEGSREMDAEAVYHFSG